MARFSLWARGGRGLGTVVVDKVCDADSEQGAVEAGVQACHSFALHDAPDGVVGGGLGALGLDLGAGGEGDEGVAVWLVIAVRFAVAVDGERGGPRGGRLT